MSWSYAALSALASVVLTGCPPDPEFTCEGDEQCGGGTTAGRCEATGHCSFADVTCESGRRYGDYAGPLEGTCVAVNLLANPTFDTGIGGWTGTNSLVTPTDIARSGAGAARVCTDTGQTFFSLSEQPATVQDAAVGAMYRATAWVRAAPDSAPVVVRLSIDERANGGVDSSSPQVSLGDTWQLLEVMHSVEVAGTIGVVVRATTQVDGGCFIADDATLSP